MLVIGEDGIKINISKRNEKCSINIVINGFTNIKTNGKLAILSYYCPGYIFGCFPPSYFVSVTWMWFFCYPFVFNAVFFQDITPIICVYKSCETILSMSYYFEDRKVSFFGTTNTSTPIHLLTETISSTIFVIAPFHS